VDWNKSKTIFIGVFLILNIFLYVQYLNVYRQSQEVEVLVEKSIEANLKDDNITYNELPASVENISYVSGKMRDFEANEIASNNLVETELIDNYTIMVRFKEPVLMRDVKTEESFKEFASYYVNEGSKYKLWEINKEEGYALFFQIINDRTLYHNASGYVKVYYGDDNKVYAYEQTMLEKIEELEQKETTIAPIQVIQSLYARNLLKADSKITEMSLGYSTLVQLTQTQVFAPTWEVRVKDADGNVEEHFVNALEGKVLDVKNTSNTLDEEGEQ
jgi:regulatory protein YycI of two-component signal transduction system YycFG